MNYENSLTFLLTNITGSFRNQLDKYLKEISLHGSQAFVLFTLWQTDGQSQINLAQTLGVSAPTINKMVKSLSENDFVFCRKCETDGRFFRVYLTQKGLDCRQSVEAQWKKMESTFFSNLSETEKLIFMQILQKLKEGKID